MASGEHTDEPESEETEEIVIKNVSDETYEAVVGVLDEAGINTEVVRRA